jgi:hypothetical protein
MPSEPKGGFEIVIASSEEQAIELLDSADIKCRALVIDINLGRDKVDGSDCPRPQGDRSGISRLLHQVVIEWASQMRWSYFACSG